jgi:hypothetical protein
MKSRFAVAAFAGHHDVVDLLVVEVAQQRLISEPSS